MRAKHASKLPLRLREKLQAHYSARPNDHPAFLRLSLSKKSDVVSAAPHSGDLHTFWTAVVQQPDFNDVVLQNIAQIVRRPAWGQSLKGLYTAGFARTLKYVLAKVGKYFEGRKNRKDV